MQAIGVRELKEHTSEILRKVRDEGASFEVTYRGRVIARLVSTAAPRRTESEHAAYWREVDRLTDAISALWPSGVSAVEAVREQRRDL